MKTITKEAVETYLERQEDYVPDVAIAGELSTSVPQIRKSLKELGERVESDGDGAWRIIKTVEQGCSHIWEFQQAPTEVGYIERCSQCNEVRLIETSEQLDELILWLNHCKERLEQQAKSSKYENEANYHLNSARQKQIIIGQIERYREVVLEKDREEILQIEVELGKIQEEYVVDSAIRYQRIIDSKLYKSLGYSNFKVYCSDRLGINYRKVYRVIERAKVINNLKTVTTLSLFPQSEKQCLVLAKLEPEHQIEVWEKGLEERNGKIPSARHLEKIIKQEDKLGNASEKEKVEETQEKLKPPRIERVLKYGKLDHGIIRLSNPEVMNAFDKYVEESGCGSLDGAIARLLGLS